MSLLRYLKKAELDKATKIKQPNGTYVDSGYTKINDFDILIETLENEIDAQIYGADINTMLRLKSPYNNLEKLLLTKLNNTADNISLYTIVIDNIRYKIKAVTPYKIDIQRL